MNVARALSARARKAMAVIGDGSGTGDRSVTDGRSVTGGRSPARDHGAGGHPSAGLVECLRHHLLAGETHYPDRPGMAELRRRVGAALPSIGHPRREPDGVLITAGERESLFVTLLGLGTPPEVHIRGTCDRGVMDWLGVRRVERPTTDPAAGIASIHAVGPALFGERAGRHATLPGSHATSPAGAAPASETAASPPSESIVIGNLDGLAAASPFRLGFVAARPSTLKQITKWKQASSICSPAPSQRAMLWALGVRP